MVLGILYWESIVLLYHFLLPLNSKVTEPKSVSALVWLLKIELIIWVFVWTRIGNKYKCIEVGGGGLNKITKSQEDKEPFGALEQNGQDDCRDSYFRMPYIWVWKIFKEFLRFLTEFRFYPEVSLFFFLIW